MATTRRHPNPGNFANNRRRAAYAGQKGGRVSPGNFKFDHDRAVRAGREGGSRKKSTSRQTESARS